MFGRDGPSRSASDESSDPRPACNQALMFKVAVGLQDRIGVNGQTGADFPSRWKPVPSPESSEQDSLPNLLYELKVRRHPRSGIKAEVNHLFTSSIVHWGIESQIGRGVKWEERLLWEFSESDLDCRGGRVVAAYKVLCR